MQTPEQKIKNLIQDTLEAAKRTDAQASGNTYVQIFIAGDSHTHIEFPLENSPKKINKK